MCNSKKRLALFASGRGSNGEALYKAMQEGYIIIQNIISKPMRIQMQKVSGMQIGLMEKKRTSAKRLLKSFIKD